MSPNPIIVAPSVLACNFGRVHEESKRAQEAGADWLHLDVMDGHFVDNISFGPAFVKAIAEVVTIPLDVHLMVTRPDHFFPRFLPPASNITVHVEAEHNVAETLDRIRQAGCTCGLSLRPTTPFSAVEPFLGLIDLLLVMTVEPGFGGQPFLQEMVAKIQSANEARARMGLSYRIEVDGGITLATGPITVAAGADTLVAGTSVFGVPDMAIAVKQLRGGA